MPRHSLVSNIFEPTDRHTCYVAKTSIAGIALLISALVQSKTLSLYHMHILYDAISLVV
jgi:hypothetical protein